MPAAPSDAIDKEKSVIVHVAALLHALTARLNGKTFAGVAPMLNEIAMDAPDISMLDAVDLVPMLSQLIAGAVTDPDHLRAMLYEVHPQLVPILVSFLQAPQAMVPDEATAAFLCAILHCLTDVVCACCREEDAAGGRRQSLQQADQQEGARGANNADSWAYLGNITSRTLCSLDTIPLVVDMINPILPDSVQQAAAELLFALIARVDDARAILAQPRSFRTLFGALGEHQNATLRAFVAACIRELANTHADVFLDGTGSKQQSGSAPTSVMDTLVRLVVLDDASDVRALAAETLETVFHSVQGSLSDYSQRRELAAALVDRLESEDVDECIVAVLKLTETLLVLEYQETSSSSSAGSRPAGGKGAPTQSLVSEYFLSSYADRLLVQWIKPHSRVGSLAARSLRLLIQVTPFHRYAAFGFVEHFASLSKLLKMCVFLASDPNASRDLASQVIRVEASLVVALCLAQDPRCRQLLESQLLEHPHYMAQLRAATLGNLNSATLDYFGDVVVLDATGWRLSHPDVVEWEHVGTSVRPTKASVQRVFDTQEDRWAADERLPQDTVSRLPFEAATDLDAAKMQRLNFILLTYVTHRTLAGEMAASNAYDSTTTATDASPIANVHDASRQQQTPHQNIEDVLRQAGGPLPTRSTMLREWTAHPQKAGAVQRAVELDRNKPRSNGNGRSATTPYPKESFVDPNNAATPSSSAQPPQFASRVVRTGSRGASRSPARDGGTSARRVGFSKFDHALKLARQFSQYYRGGADVGNGSRVTVYETSGDGFARRQASSGASRTAMDPTSSSRAVPASAAPPSASSSQYRGWCIDQLKEGDLFYFVVPLLDVSHHALEQIRARAIRHLNVIKKAFVVTPQAAKRRRWFLFDMATYILPGIIHTVSQLIEVFVLHGDEAAKFPMIMFREQHALQDSHHVDGDHGAGDVARTAALHAGNLLEVLDQVRFYFSNVSRANPAVAAGGASSSPGGARRSTYLQDLEQKIAILSAQKFNNSAAADITTAGSDAMGGVADAGSSSRYYNSNDAYRPSDVSPPVRMPKSFQYDSDEDDVM